MKQLHVGSILVFSMVALTAIQGAAAESSEAKIARARSAAPTAIAEKARVQDVDGTLLQRGTTGWTCMPGIGPGDAHPMCNDETWMRLLQAVGSKTGFSTDRIGISYMLQGDAKVSNADPYATDQNNGDVWVQEGPHLMVIVPRGLLKNLSDDPNNGGPYVMWADTPYAHIMIPVTEPAHIRQTALGGLGG